MAHNERDNLTEMLGKGSMDALVKKLAEELHRPGGPRPYVEARLLRRINKRVNATLRHALYNVGPATFTKKRRPKNWLADIYAQAIKENP